MALVNVTHKPTAASARQFDGSYESLLDMLDARSAANVSATLTFNPNGDFTGLQLSGGNVGGLALTVGDWAIFPADPAEPAFVLPDSQALNYWQAV